MISANLFWEAEGLLSISLLLLLLGRHSWAQSSRMLKGNETPSEKIPRRCWEGGMQKVEWERKRVRRMSEMQM